MKKMAERYYSPTPKKWRKIGDSILYGLGFIGTAGLVSYDQIQELFPPAQLKALIISFFVLGFAGKFITNFFKDDENEAGPGDSQRAEMPKP